LAIKAFHYVGLHHIDLAWKRPREEYVEMLEVFCLRILDALDQRPDFKFVLEQAAHYRALITTRPDLVARLKPHVQSGRLEFVGGMASTLETNMPCGESFVRNQQLGLKWVKQHFGVVPKTGWLIDTFGVHAQVPQILRQFGIADLMANRLGGRQFRTVFLAEGLDGTRTLIAGADVYSAYLRPDHVSIDFYKSWEAIDRSFDRLASMDTEGPFMVMPHAENELFISLHANDVLARKAAEHPGEVWRTSTPSEYFAAVREADPPLTVVGADLNPEFTGCFSLRTPIRIRNRETETLLLEAEKWAALAGIADAGDALEEAWWSLAFVQFHDVFTGSHPTSTFLSLMTLFDTANEAARAVLGSAQGRNMPGTTADADRAVLTVFNGLPWDRQDLVSVPVPAGWEGVGRVSAGDEDLPFDVSAGQLRVMAPVPATGFRHLTLQAGAAVPGWRDLPSSVIENEFIRLECDKDHGIGRLVLKQTGQVLMDGAGDFLVVQHDEGSFQIENPVEAEVVAAAGRIDQPVAQAGPLGQHVLLTGAFPKLSWTGPESHLGWELELSLLKGQPWLDVKLRLDWKGECSRIRLKVSTTLDTSGGIYEIPFGTVRRRPYGVTGNAKGEWPAHRFVVVQDQGHGLALVNKGTAGVEVNGGTIHNTLIRAPKAEYSGMVSDDTSSQHGRHEFGFALVPYAGHWADAPVVQAGQALNNPLMASMTQGALAGQRSEVSFLKVDATNLVLSAVKAPDDRSDDLIVRLYETAGRATDTGIWIRDATDAWASDLPEARGPALPIQDQTVSVAFAPFEIKTLRVRRGA
jgi:alpha-mannosidase